MLGTRKVVDVLDSIANGDQDSIENYVDTFIEYLINPIVQFGQIGQIGHLMTR